MKHRKLYCRMMYSMAYVCAGAIVVFSYLGIPYTILISLAILLLVAGGFLSIGEDKIKEEAVKTTTLDEELEDARKVAAKESGIKSQAPA